jgi:3'-phosphoadenosine 5'-phosphosulfate sulfotransferase (PAPS reductase)/FAD synthetase
MPDLRQYEVWAQTSAHRARLDRARARIEAAAKLGPVVVLSSWGKDSQAMVEMAIDVLGSATQVRHLASAYRLPGWDAVEAHYAIRCRVQVVPDRRSVEDVIAWLRQVGLPHERTSKGKVKAGTKVKTARGIESAVDGEVHLMGMRIDEGGPRAISLRKRGHTYAARGHYVCCPLVDWTSQDVWAVIASRGLPYLPLYDCETHGQTRETLRNTGWLTLAGWDNGRVAWLAAHYPDLYKRLRTEFPQLEMFR